jgi:hypothetical protein
MKISKTWLWVLGVTAVLLLYHLDAITGQWKFNQLCKAEAGARYFEPVVGGQGWEVESTDKTSGYVPVLNLGAAFARFTDESGIRSDVRTTKPLFTDSLTKYSFSPVDESRSVRYRYKYSVEEIDADPRFKRFSTRVLDLTTGRIAASNTVIVYAWTSSNRVILNAPTGQKCGGGEGTGSFFSTIRNQGIIK